MRIKIPSHILNFQDEIKEIQIFINSNLALTLDIYQIKHSHFFYLHESLSTKFNEIIYKVIFEDHHKIMSQTKSEIMNENLQSIHKNLLYKKGSIKDNNDARYVYLETEITEKIIFANTFDNFVLGEKTLIYFSIYGEEYAKLFIEFFHLFLGYKNVDLLIITDEDTSTFIKNNSNHVFKYHLTSKTTGVEASINKLKIYEIENIYEYNKVIFLDTDIIPVRNLDNFLNLKIINGILYALCPNNLSFYYHKNFYHGFDFLSVDFINKHFNKNSIPFNAGQFMFIPTKQMLQHFKNVVDFYEQWTGNYFFEQSFMNHYFCRANIVDITTLNSFISITNIENTDSIMLTENTCLIHFSGNPLDANFKLSYIKNFLNESAIES